MKFRDKDKKYVQKNIHSFFNAADVNGDNSIDWEEF